MVRLELRTGTPTWLVGAWIEEVKFALINGVGTVTIAARTHNPHKSLDLMLSSRMICAGTRSFGRDRRNRYSRRRGMLIPWSPSRQPEGPYYLSCPRHSVRFPSGFYRAYDFHR